MSDGRLLHVNVSTGGVPKLPVSAARITRGGVEGDRQRAVTVHGGPHRAVSILGIEAIRRVAAEGHPIAPGTTGENLTVEGFDVSSLPVGTRLAIGDEVVLELASPTNPCRTIRHSFHDLRFGRLGISAHPADSRMYARVIHEGTVRPGDPISLSAPMDGGAERLLLAARLDRAERASALAMWRAARAAGHELAILDDGELAVAAAPSLGGPTFNLALGFAHLPNLVDRAVAHFTQHGTTGWIWTDAPPWPGAALDSTAAYATAWVADVPRAEVRDGIRVRELPRSEVGPWAEVIVAASEEMAATTATAWGSLEGPLALAAHHHRFVAELDGRAVGAGSLHVHRGVGWLRGGSVRPEARGRGIQQALIAARAARAMQLGCDLVGASADLGSSSLRNLERAGFRPVATRGRYRVEAAA
ncbi:MAG TPA: GNAT family N-acetyltransferase [Candidatus Limnocylindria bacterium]|nr:GNAT family N-acetyltransferase [Candidatus Limnocylindria bacterium]